MSRSIAFCIIVTLTALPLDAAEIPFAPPADASGVVAGPRDVAIVDWNSDGRLDLLVAPFDATGPLRYYRNETFGWVGSDLGPAVLNPSSVEVGDIDGDGTPDVLYTASGDNRVRAVLNRTSALIVSLDTAIDNPLMAVLGDLDGDGDLDAAATSFDGGQVYWYENTAGNGESWTRSLVGAIGGGPRDIDPADLDGDGDLDLAVVTFSRIVWYENRLADGLSWSLHDVESSLPAGWTLDTGDIDSDGDIDIVAGAVNTPALAWWINPGGPVVGSWTAFAITTGVAPADIEVADVDLDGDPDVVVARFAGGTSGDVRWYENDLGTLFTMHPVASGYDIPRATALGDLDQDGDPDVVIAGGGSDRVDTVRNRTIHRSTSYDQPYAASPGGGAVIVAASWDDFDGDGDLDLLTFEDDHRIRWRDSLTGAASDVQAVSQDLNSPRAFATADIDGDGDPDALIATAIGLEWFENHGVPGVWSRHTISPKGSIDAVWIADVNGDGLLDVIGNDASASEVRWWRHPATAGWFDNFLASYTTFGALTTGDVDGDGDLEVVIGRNGAVVVYERIADAVWDQITVGTASVNDLELGDMDGDGDLDIVAAISTLAAARLFDNLGSSGWGSPTTVGLSAVAQSLGLADLDHDGTMDVVVDQAPSTIRTLLGHGDGTTFTPRTWAMPTSAIAIHDLDDDGRPDIAGFGANDRAVSVSDGGGQFGLQFIGATASVATEGTLSELAAIWGAHLGRPGDGAIDLVSLRVRLSSSGIPLTPSQVAAVFENLSVWRETGFNTTLDPDSDALLGFLDPLVPTASGEYVVPVTATDGSETIPAPTLIHQFPLARIYLAADIAPGAFGTLSGFEIAILPPTTSTLPAAVDGHAIPLETWVSYQAPHLVVVASGDIFADGFESGSASAWSATVP